MAGIHCAGLTGNDFKVLGEKRGAMIWSPLSNLLLYGQTARIKAAKEENVRIEIGSDWSPSGSKNLLRELKVTRLVSQAGEGLFSDREIISMATTQAAAILQWDATLGSIEPGKRADLLVVFEASGDPYELRLTAEETSTLLVIINGIARYGLPGLMRQLGATGEDIRVGGLSRTVFLQQENADPTMLAGIGSGARTTGCCAAGMLSRLMRGLPKQQEWTLAVDELEDTVWI